MVVQCLRARAHWDASRARTRTYVRIHIRAQLTSYPKTDAMELEQHRDENESQFNMNCTSFTVEDFKFLNRLRNITAIICAAITVAILLFLICRKAYSSLFQRLYFYLVIGTLLTEIAIGLNIEHQWHYERQEPVCVWLGFFTQWTFVFVFVLSYEIVIHLLCLVATKMKGSSSPQCRPVRSKCCAVTLEVVYIALPVSISTGFAIFPYVRKSYGVAGPWCWVRSLNEQCEPSGFVTQVAFYSLYVSVGVIGMAASLVFAVIYLKMSKEARHLLKKTLYLMIFQFIHILVIMCNFSLRLYTLISRRHQLYGLWSAHAFTIPIGVIVFLLGYLLCFYPVKKVFFTFCKRMAQACSKSKITVKQVEVPSVTKVATAPKSDRVSQPSDTFFIVPHPDSVISETSPLIIHACTAKIKGLV